MHSQMSIGTIAVLRSMGSVAYNNGSSNDLNKKDEENVKNSCSSNAKEEEL